MAQLLLHALGSEPICIHAKQTWHVEGNLTCLLEPQEAQMCLFLFLWIILWYNLQILLDEIHIGLRMARLADVYIPAVLCHAGLPETARQYCRVRRLALLPSPIVMPTLTDQGAMMGRISTSRPKLQQIYSCHRCAHRNYSALLAAVDAKVAHVGICHWLEL